VGNREKKKSLERDGGKKKKMFLATGVEHVGEEKKGRFHSPREKGDRCGRRKKRRNLEDCAEKGKRPLTQLEHKKKNREKEAPGLQFTKKRGTAYSRGKEKREKSYSTTTTRI